MYLNKFLPVFGRISQCVIEMTIKEFQAVRWGREAERELWTVGTGTLRPRRREWGSENKVIPVQWRREGGQSKKCQGECSGREGPSPHAVWLPVIKGPSRKEIATLAGCEGRLGPAGWIAGGLVFLLQPILKITKVIFPGAKSELNSCMFNKHHLGHLFQLKSVTHPSSLCSVVNLLWGAFLGSWVKSGLPLFTIPWLFLNVTGAHRSMLQIQYNHFSSKRQDP